MISEKYFFQTIAVLQKKKICENLRVLNLQKSVENLSRQKAFQFIVLILLGFFGCKNPDSKKIILSCSTENSPKSFEISNDATELDLYDNGITNLPATIGELKNLKTINLRGNQLTSLPDQFSQLKNLEILSLSANSFNDFPPPLEQMKNLKVLCLDRNLFSGSEQKRIISLLPNCEIKFDGDEDED